jgi:hypothetical protein
MTWHRKTIASSLNIYFKGDYKIVQKAIYNWLDTPERKSNFNI